MKHVAWIACVVGLAVLSGCVSQAKYDALLAQNEIQSAKVKGLERDLDQARISVDALRTQLLAKRDARDAGARLVSSKDNQIGLLKSRCTDLEARIKRLGDELTPPDGGGITLPPEVRDALRKLAESEPSLEFNPATGACKFASDILFDTGEDTIKPKAAEVIKRFAAIFTSVGKDLHLRIEGHTDDRRIAKATTRKNHPTNWHLSVHRAISVLRALNGAGIGQDRMCAAGYGKWRPLVENTNALSRAQNRRVEIYVINAPPVVETETVAAEPTVMGGE